MKNKFMQRAIELSIESINSGGGPFGSVIVKDGKIISEEVKSRLNELVDSTLALSRVE